MKKILYFIFITFIIQVSLAQTAVNVDLSEKYQTIDNFGASDAWVTDGIGKYWSEANKELIAKYLFSTTEGIGLSSWRFNIGAGSAVTDTDIIPNWRRWRRAECFQQEENGSFDWTKQSGQQYFLNQAKDYGVNDIIAFLNSPPVWATKNGHAQCDSSVGSTNLKEGYEDEFAAFMVTVIKHFRDQGININYLSPINEPSWAWNKAVQEGCRYNNEDVVRVINALYEELSDNDLVNLVEIDAPEVTEYAAALDDDLFDEFSWNSSVYTGGMNGEGQGTYKNYIKLLFEDANFSKKIGNKIAMHGYFADSWEDRLTKLRELVKENVDRYNEDAHIWMSEYTILGDATDARPFVGGGRDLGMTLGLHTAKIIHRDLTRMNANAWQWWTAISRVDYKDGLLYTDWGNDGDSESLYTSKNLWAMGNYSRFIRPGYKRVKVDNPDDWYGIQACGFVSPEEDKLILVYINSTSNITQINTNISNLPNEIQQITPYITSDTMDLEKGTELTSLMNYSLPGKSVVTLVVAMEDNTLDIEKFETKTTYTTIYPVPVFDDLLTIDLVDHKKAEVIIFNTAGQAVFTNSLNETLNTLDLQQLSAGVYFVRITGDDFIDIKKITVN